MKYLKTLIICKMSKPNDDIFILNPSLIKKLINKNRNKIS